MNRGDRSLATLLVGSVIGAGVLTGAAALGPAGEKPAERPVRGFELERCDLGNGKQGYVYDDGLCLLAPPIASGPVTESQSESTEG